MATATSGWALNGPVKTAVEDARRLVYTLSGDRHGVATRTDLRVLPMDPPGPGIQVTRGSALIRSRYDEGETYLGSHNQTVTYATTPTPSSQGRSDLVVMRVEDPWARNSPWEEPAEGEADAREFFPIRIIEGVAPTTTARHLSDVPGHEHETGIVLYRIDQPANNATVQEAMIKDLRVLSAPKRADASLVRTPAAGSSGKANNFIGTWQVFPPDMTGGKVRTPEWAEWAQVEIEYAGVWAGAGTAHVDVRAALGDGTTTVRTGLIGYLDSSTSRKTLALSGMGGVAIPPELRGREIYITPDIALQAQQQASALPEFNEWTSVRIRVTFYESRADQIVAI